MRLPYVAMSAALAVVGACGNKSKLDADRGSDVDALWDLAPDGTELGIVASPRAVGLTLDAIVAVRSLTAQPDLAAAKPQLDGLAQAMFGSETAAPADAGFGAKPFALFATADGVIGIMPVTDRDKFMTAKKGTRGSAEDTLEANTCREIKSHYICTTQVAMFDRLGKGSLRGKVKVPGARGDAELYMAGATLLGDTKGDLAIAIGIERGQVSLDGKWSGTPSGVFAKLAGVSAPRPKLDGATGFVTLNVAPLLASLPQIPIAGGVTSDQLAASIVGPLTATIPAGSIDIQIRMPLKDAAPATKIIENCPDISVLFELAKDQKPGACRIRLQGTNALELDMWVENNELRLGANKAAPVAGKPGAVTPLGREIAHADWTGALWGRGTMLNLTGIAPATEGVPEEVALGIHAMALVNELGAALDVKPDGIRFRAALRTVWSNPPDLVAKYIAVPGADIVTGKATETGKSLAATAPTSPFAADFNAGQGGLMIPAAAIGLATAVIIPAIQRYISGDAPTEDPTTEQPQMAPGDLASLLVRAYVEEAYPKWLVDNKGKKCPAKLADLATYFGEDPGIPVMTDPWGHELVLQCDDKGLAVLSIGEDGTLGTPDDVRAP